MLNPRQELKAMPRDLKLFRFPSIVDIWPKIPLLTNLQSFLTLIDHVYLFLSDY